jgi:hypothetical protein
MTPKDYRATIARLGLSQVAAARFVGVGERHSRKWASGDTAVPRSVEMLLLLSVMLVEKFGVPLEEIERV